MAADNFGTVYKNHYIFRGKREGEVKQLKGDVVVIIFFVNDVNSHWNEAAEKKFLKKVDTALNIIAAEAEKERVNLRLRRASCQLDVSCECSVRNHYSWPKKAILECNSDSISEYQKHYKGVYNCEEAPVIFALNKEFRSYSLSADTSYPSVDEYTALSCEIKPYMIIHELLHQFGASDYYYPREVKKAADKYFPDSLMNVADGTAIDSLTKYLIGWRQILSDSAAKFLAETRHCTQADVEKALKEEWK